MIFINLLGAIAILLWATRMVRLGVSRYLGARLPAMMESATQNRFRASMVGMGIASMLQSASATVVLASSFVKQGVITVPMGIAILLGADIGSTIMVQVLSFDVSWFSPIAFLLGYVIFVRGKDTRTSEIGRAIMGIGLIILSLQIMSVTMRPLSSETAFTNLLNTLVNQKFLAFMLVALATWFMHSSIAMVLIIIGLSGGSTIPFDFALLLVLGINVGASFIPMALTFRSSSEAKSVPFAGFLMRVGLVMVFVPFISFFAQKMQVFITSDGYGIALFHTVFNITVLVTGLPLVKVLAKFCTIIFPSQTIEKKMGAKSLKKEYLVIPDKALKMTEKEIAIQAGYVENMLGAIVQIIKKDDYKRIQKVEKMDDYVDALYEDIKIYVTKITSLKMSEDEARRATNIITYTTNLEHAGDIIEKNILPNIEKKMSYNILFSSAGWKEIQSIHGVLMEQMRLSIVVFEKGGVEDARQLLRGKKQLQELENKAKDKHFERLRDGNVDSLKSSSLHLDLVQDLKRINAHLCSIAYPILEKHGVLPLRRK